MDFVTLLGIIILVVMTMVLWSVWKLVRAPLPLEMQQELERKEDAKLNALKNEVSATLAQEMRRMWEQMQGQVRTTEQSVSQKLQQANDTFSSVTRELGRLQESTRKVEEVGRSVATLQDLLRSPKMRGGLGEFFLAELLAQILPADSFALQYEFQDGKTVDAVIRLGDKMVPVDSKFPLESFQRMGQAVTDDERAQWRKEMVSKVKSHIDAISDKYIRPTEGTLDFALMYIPAENVYYEAILKEEGLSDEKSLFQHAIRRKVIPVSPNSFYAYLQVILQGLRGYRVEQQAQEILESLQKLQKEMGSLREDFDKVGKQLGNARENFEKADKHLAKFEGQLTAVEAPLLTVAQEIPVKESTPS